MDLTNRTRFPALLHRGMIRPDRLFAAVVARLTYELQGTQAVLAEEQSWPVSPAPWNCLYGPMDHDNVFRRGGIDIMLFGTARAPQNKAVRELPVVVKAGGQELTRLIVSGERRWERKEGKYVPSKPEPFTELALILANAFGGKDTYDELEIPFASNMFGKGYCIDEANAVGKLLPNLENVKQRMENWYDTPEPAGVAACPFTHPGRGRSGVLEGPIENPKVVFNGKIFNAAYPDLVVKELTAGTPIEVEGMDFAGPLKMEVPYTRLAAKIDINGKQDSCPLAIDQVGWEVDKQKLFVTYRFAFRYQMIPRQIRKVELVALD